MARTRSHFPAAVFVALLTSSSSAHAYRTGADLLDLDPDARVSWAPEKIVIVVNDMNPSGLSESDFERSLSDAIDSWTIDDCEAPSVEYDGTTDDEAGAGDGVNTIQWVTSGWDEYGPDDAAAATDVQYEESEDGYSIVEADIYLNAATMSWANVGLGPMSEVSLAAVLRHELGHLLGLAHPCELEEADGPMCDESTLLSSLMHPLYSQSLLTTITSPGEDDTAGLCFLYDEETQEIADGDAGVGDDAGLAEGDASAEDGAGETSGEGDMGDPCTSADDCRGMQCVAGFSSCGGICTRECSQGTEPCPHGYQCSDVADRAVCVPVTPEKAPTCSLIAAPSNGRRVPLLAAFAFAVFCLSQCRRRRA